jgi:DNA-binding NarL/FixJ family response regulator
LTIDARATENAADVNASECPVGERIRVLCVDDHALMREGLAMIIDSQPDMSVIASAKNGEDAVAQFLQHRPDVTLMDLELPRMHGLDAIAGIRRVDPSARIIVLTMYSGEEDIHRALRAGAATYLLKDTLSRDLVRIVREVYQGTCRLPDEVAARLKARAELPALTAREVEVLELVTIGLRNKEISGRLGISIETVHKHLVNIFTKLEVRDRAEAIAVGIRRGIVHHR